MREQVQQYGRDGFQPGIIKAVRVDKARSHEESQATGMNKVTTKDVCNWLRTVKPDASTDFGCTQSKAPLIELMLHMEVADARLFLTNTGYKQEFIRCPIGKDGKSRWVLVFVNKEQLENLGKLGHAFQFDGVYWRLQSLPADQSALKTQELANRLREVSKAMSIEMLLN